MWACVCTSVRWLNVENWVRTKCKEDLFALLSHPFTVETPSFIQSLITPKMRRTGKRESFKTQLHIQYQRSVVHVFGLSPLNTKKWLPPCQRSHTVCLPDFHCKLRLDSLFDSLLETFHPLRQDVLLTKVDILQSFSGVWEPLQIVVVT